MSDNEQKYRPSPGQMGCLLLGKLAEFSRAHIDSCGVKNVNVMSGQPEHNKYRGWMCPICKVQEVYENE
jgi:hypothetical protein